MDQTKKEDKKQRIIKLKTLDNKMIELGVDSEINIKELKQIISQKFDNIAIERVRLIFKGKQLKDDEKLSDHVNKDNEIIHLMFKTIEQTQNNSNTNTNTTQTNNNQTQNNQQGPNSFSNILNNLINNPAIINLTNMIVSNIGGNEGSSQVVEIINSNQNNQNELIIQREIPLNNNNTNSNNNI